MIDYANDWLVGPEKESCPREVLSRTGGRKQVLEGDTSLEHASEKWIPKKLPLSGATKKRTFRSGEGMALKDSCPGLYLTETCGRRSQLSLRCCKAGKSGGIS